MVYCTVTIVMIAADELHVRIQDGNVLFTIFLIF